MDLCEQKELAALTYLPPIFSIVLLFLGERRRESSFEV